MRGTNKHSELHPVTVLVLNYNGLEHLRDCLSSLQNQSYPNYKISLIDNASTDESIRFVKKNFPAVKIVANKSNTGTAGGFNFGAKFVETEFILFLANDIKAEPNLIEELMCQITGDNSIAMGSPKMMNFHEPELIDYAGIKMDIFGFPLISGHGEKDGDQYNVVKESVPTGTCLLIRKSIFDKVGGYDDDYFTLSDELDLWWRIRLLGYKCVFVPQTKIYHKAAATLSQFKRSKLRFFSERNTTRNLLKNYSALTLAKTLPQYFVLLVAEILFYLFLRRVDMSVAIIRAVFWNVTHFKTTYTLRRKIQRIRKINDDVIEEGIIKRSIKLDIFRHWLKGDFKL